MRLRSLLLNNVYGCRRKLPATHLYSCNTDKKSPRRAVFCVQWLVTYQVTMPAMTTKMVQMTTIAMMLSGAFNGS